MLGLPCSGKTTIAKIVKERLKDKGLVVVHLDGDYIRSGLNMDLDFTYNGISENIRRTGEVAKLLNKQGIVVIASFVTPFQKTRDFLKSIIGRCIEVWVKCPAAVCAKRDIKGMWKLAKIGAIKNFIGWDTPFDVPLNPDIRVDSDINSAESCANMIMSYLYLNQLLDYPGHEYSMFIGRYQPFHKGHQRLIETVLKEGKDVCIAIKDTVWSKANPYSVGDRRRMIEKALKKWIEKGKVAIIVIPNVMEVCYGRRVGWGVREIRLDKKIEEISATKIRSCNLCEKGGLK